MSSWTKELDRAVVVATSRGHYHWTLFLLLCLLAAIPTSLLTFSQVFIAATPDHWCSAPPELLSLNMTADELKSITIPLEKDSKDTFQQCHMFDINIITLRKEFPDLIRDVSHYQIEDGILKMYQAQKFSLEDRSTDVKEVVSKIRNGSWDIVPCKYGWTFDKRLYKRTLVTDLELVCDEGWWPSTSNSLFWIGSVFGNIIFGWLSDKWGRRPTILIMISLEVPLSIVASFVSDYPTYTALRILGGLFFPALYQIPLILAFELMPPKSRTYTGMAIGMLFATGMCLLSGLAYVLRDWFTLSLAISVPFVILYSYYWIIPESPRWLIGKGKVSEAEYVLIKLAKANGIKLNMGFLQEIHEQIKAEEIEPTPIVPEVKLNGEVLAFLDDSSKEESYNNDRRIGRMETFRSDREELDQPNIGRVIALEVAEIFNKKTKQRCDSESDLSGNCKIVETKLNVNDSLRGYDIIKDSAESEELVTDHSASDELLKDSEGSNLGIKDSSGSTEVLKDASEIITDSLLSIEESHPNLEQKATQTENRNADVYSLVEEQVSILDIWRYKNIRRKFVILTFNWIANGVVYNGLSYNSPHLGVNEYLAFFIGGVVEIPSYFIAWKLMDKYGRRWILFASMSIGGVACMSTVFAPLNSPWLVVTLAMIGKLCVAASFAVFYVFVGELLPTVLRAQAMGAASFVAGLTFLTCPYIVVLANVSRSLPLIVLGALCLCGGGAALLLPETLNQPLPQTLQDGETFGGDRAECWPFASVRRTSL